MCREMISIASRPRSRVWRVLMAPGVYAGESVLSMAPMSETGASNIA